MKASKKELSIKSFLIIIHTIILYCIMAHDISIIYYSIAGFIVGSFAFKSTAISSICVIAANLVRYTKTVSYIPLVGVLASSINNLNETNSNVIHSTIPESIGDSVINGNENIPSIDENETKRYLLRQAEDASSVQERNTLLQQIKELLSDQERNDFLKWQLELPELADEEDALLRWKVRKNLFQDDEIDKKNKEKELNHSETDPSIRISDSIIDRIVMAVSQRVSHILVRELNKGIRGFLEYDNRRDLNPNYLGDIPLGMNYDKEDDRSSTSLFLEELPGIKSQSPSENKQNPSDNAKRTKKDKNTRRKTSSHVKGKFYKKDLDTSSVNNGEWRLSIREKERRGLIKFKSPDKSSDSWGLNQDNKEKSPGKNENNTSDDVNSDELSDNSNGSNPKCDKST